MKKKAKKAIRKEMKDAMEQMLSSLNIINPSKKLRKLIDTQAKRLSDQVSTEIERKFKKRKKRATEVDKKVKAVKKSKKGHDPN